MKAKLENMNKRTQKLAVSNYHTELLQLFLEPWGEDYYLQAGATFEVVAEGTEDNFHFTVTLPNSEMVTVWVDGTFSDISVQHEGTALVCGHNRPPGP